MKIKINHKFINEILFEYDKKENSIKLTLEAGVKININFRYANLRGADLGCANLRRADLGCANLEYANLRRADLGCADLRYADLRYADLGDADLGCANLRGADLGCANLKYANLKYANLGGADLGCANLGGANLGGADLGCANLGCANLENVKIPPINNHFFISEILFRMATNENQKDFAARIRLETNKCWKYFIQLARDKGTTVWARKTLEKWDEFKIEIAKYK